MRPLFVAVFLAYVLMPYHGRLRRHIGTPGSIGVLVAITALALFLLAVAVYVSVLGLDDDRPRLEARAVEITHKLEDVIGKAAPWTEEPDAAGKPAQSKLAEHVTRADRRRSSRSPPMPCSRPASSRCTCCSCCSKVRDSRTAFAGRIRRSGPRRSSRSPGRSVRAIISYLRAKVKSSLVLAVPVGIVLWAGRREVRAPVGDPDVPVQLHPVHRQR